MEKNVAIGKLTFDPLIQLIHYDLIFGPNYSYLFNVQGEYTPAQITRHFV